MQTGEPLNIQLLNFDKTTGFKTDLPPHSRNLIDKEILHNCNDEEEIRSMFVIPVQFADCSLGAMVFLNKLDTTCDSAEEDCKIFGKFTAEEEQIGVQLAEMLAIAMYYKQLNKITEKMVTTYNYINLCQNINFLNNLTHIFFL